MLRTGIISGGSSAILRNRDYGLGQSDLQKVCEAFAHW